MTGASGQVGGELLHTLAPLGTVIAPSRAEMNLADPNSVGEFIRRVEPHWIVSAGAYTAVDKAQSEPELALTVNAKSVGVIGVEAKKLGASVIHYSTDYVFSGQGTTPWVETDPTGPLGVYGRTKLAGEQALLRSGAVAFLFRTSWVYGATGKNFLRTILKLAQEREELRIVNDQHGAPTWSRDLARLAAHVIGRSVDGVPQAPGIYHAAGSGETTWAGFAAKAIRQVQQRDSSANLATIVGIPSSEYPTPAARPSNSRLDCCKLATEFAWNMMDWRDSLSRVIEELYLSQQHT